MPLQAQCALRKEMLAEMHTVSHGLYWWRGVVIPIAQVSHGIPSSMVRLPSKVLALGRSPITSNITLMPTVSRKLVCMNPGIFSIWEAFAIAVDAQTHPHLILFHHAKRERWLGSLNWESELCRGLNTAERILAFLTHVDVFARIWWSGYFLQHSPSETLTVTGVDPITIRQVIIPSSLRLLSSQDWSWVKDGEQKSVLTP